MVTFYNAAARFRLTQAPDLFVPRSAGCVPRLPTDIWHPYFPHGLQSQVVKSWNPILRIGSVKTYSVVQKV